MIPNVTGEILIVFLETKNEKNILSSLRRAAKNNTNDLSTHIIYAGPYNLDWIEWEPEILQRMVEKGLESSTMTFIYMYRDLLITKEKMKKICSGKGFRQKDHETPAGGDTYKDSVGDDLELFFEDIKLGRSPLSMAWTFYAPELTLKEMELVDKKDQDYFRSFKWLNNADVNGIEMDSSSSTSKYVSAYCRRRTIKFVPKIVPTYFEMTEYPLQLRNNNSSNVAINIAEREFGAEEKSLLGGQENPERKAQSIFETFFQDVKGKLLDTNWRLFCVVLVLHIVIGAVIGGTIVELLIHKAPTTTQRSETPTIPTPSTALSTTTNNVTIRSHRP